MTSNLMTVYFMAEKHEALLFMLVGAAATLLSFWLLKTADRYRAAAIPLIAIAAVQLTVGSTVYFRTDAQISELSSLHQADPASYVQQETERMQVVVDNFVIYRWIEIGLLLVGLVMCILKRGQTTWLAIGAGLAIQSGIILSLDYFAEQRAFEYQVFVTGSQTSNSAAPSSSQQLSDDTLIVCKGPRHPICTREYRPVCGLRDTGIRCVTTPCDSSEWKTFGNPCTACADEMVSGYQAGECK